MRANITLPLETLKSIIARAREYELADDEDEFDDDDEDQDDDSDDDDDEPLRAANDDEDDDYDGDEDDDEEDDEEDDEGEDEEDDGEEDLEDVLEKLTSEELAELLALSWVGEGDYANWDEAIGKARGLSQDDIIEQLAENPGLSKGIERGLVALGYKI
jgi:hypothetical protein